MTAPPEGLRPSDSSPYHLGELLECPRGAFRGARVLTANCADHVHEDGRWPSGVYPPVSVGHDSERLEVEAVGTRYWLDESPVEIRTEKNVLRYFPKARRLQVALPDWTNEDGQSRPGKMVTLDVAALAQSGDQEDAHRVVAAILAKLVE